MNNSFPTKCHEPRTRRAAPSGISLTSHDAALVKGMLDRGDRSHDVAAYFGVNPGRVAEISTGERFFDVPVASANELPPPGPYVRPCDAETVRVALAAARQTLERAERLIEGSAS